jgi:hypothetical protein
VTLKLRSPLGGDFKVPIDGEASLSVSDPDDKIELICLAADPTGVSEVTMSFDGSLNNICSSINPLPALGDQKLQPDSAVNPVPLFATLQGPFTCGTAASAGPPYGDTIVVTCSSSNFSSTSSNRSAETKVLVHLSKAITNPSAPPKVTLMTRHTGGTFMAPPDGKATLSQTEDSLEFKCEASDPTRLSDMNLRFDATGDCWIDGGAIEGGGATSIKPLPAAMDQKFDPETAATDSSLSATLKGPFTCQAGAGAGIGTPALGSEVVVTCVGSNFSSSSDNRSTETQVVVLLK